MKKSVKAIAFVFGIGVLFAAAGFELKPFETVNSQAATCTINWVPVPAGTFSQIGTYRIDIYGNGTRIASTSLDVDEEATLMRNAGTN